VIEQKVYTVGSAESGQTLDLMANMLQLTFGWGSAPNPIGRTHYALHRLYRRWAHSRVAANKGI